MADPDIAGSDTVLTVADPDIAGSNTVLTDPDIAGSNTILTDPDIHKVHYRVVSNLPHWYRP